MSKEAMKLALDALGEIEWSNNSQWQSDRAKVAITALREALAEPTSADYAMGYAEGFNDACKPAQHEPEHIVHSNGRYSPLLTHMMNERVKSNLKQVIELYDSPDQPTHQCWKCGDMDASFQAKCNVPACGMKEQPAQQEPVYHLKQFGDVTKVQLDRYMATGDINAKPVPPPECQTEAEKTAFAFGWFKALESVREQPAQQEFVAWGIDWGKAGDIPCVSIIKRLPDGGMEVVAMEYGPAQPQQEPVAWWDENLGVFDEKHFDQLQPLYPRPPQRQWVGLTNNELQPIADEYRILFGSWVEDFARAIEAKLKEKNT